MGKQATKTGAREQMLERDVERLLREVAKIHAALYQKEQEARYLRERLQRLDVEPGGHGRTCALHTVLVDLGFDVSRRVLHDAGYSAERALVRLRDMSDDDAMERARLDMVRIQHNDPSLTMQSPAVRPYLKRTHDVVGSEWEHRETCPRCDGAGSSPLSWPASTKGKP